MGFVLVYFSIFLGDFRLRSLLELAQMLQNSTLKKNETAAAGGTNSNKFTQKKRQAVANLNESEHIKKSCNLGPS